MAANDLENDIGEVVEDAADATKTLLGAPIAVVEDLVSKKGAPYGRVTVEGRQYAVRGMSPREERMHMLFLAAILVLWWASVATIAGVFGVHYFQGSATPYFISTTNFLTTSDSDDHVMPNNCVGGSFLNPCPPRYHTMQAFAWPFAMGITICMFALIFIAIWLIRTFLHVIMKSDYILSENQRAKMTTWDIIDYYTFKPYRDSIYHDHHFLLSHVFSCIIGLFLHFIIGLTIGEGIQSIYVPVILAFVFFASELCGLWMTWENRRKNAKSFNVETTHIRSISFPAWFMRIGLWTLVIVIELIFFTRYPTDARQTNMYIMFIFELVLSFLQAGGLQGLYYAHLSPVLRNMSWMKDRDEAYAIEYYGELIGKTRPYTVYNPRFEFTWTLNPIAYEWGNHFFNLCRVTIVTFAFWGLTHDHTYIPLFDPSFPL